MKSPFEMDELGRRSWTPKKGDMYLVTGKDRGGKRFRIMCESWIYINSINVYQGRKWLIRDGKKHLIQVAIN